MTTSIYIKGDIGGPLQQIEVYDAHTGRQLDDVAEMLFAVGSPNGGTITKVKVRRLNQSGFEDLELFPAPPVQMAGVPLYGVSLEQSKDTGRCATRIEGMLQKYKVLPNGDIEDDGPAVHIHKEVDDTALAMARNPDDILLAERQHAVASLTHELAQDVEANTFYVKGLRSGRMTALNATNSTIPAGAPVYATGGPLPGVTPFPPSQWPAGGGFDKASRIDRVLARDKAEIDELLTCDECKGTGEVHLLNDTVTCSRGCKP